MSPSHDAQNFANHSKIVPPYHYFLFAVIGINILWSLYQAIFEFSYQALVDLLLSVGLFFMFFYVRVFPLKVHDRVIRLEETLRMQRLLPAELMGRISELKSRDFVALRFASDEELPALTQRVLDGEFNSAKEIKASIKNWRPDHARV